MKNIDVSAARTFAIMGHTGSGKTTLVDALLFKLGLNDRLGAVAAGTSAADWTEPEKARKITLQAKPFGGVFKAADGQAYALTFCDTPGYMDFYGQVIAASSVCESALLVVDATSGVQLGTRKAWDRVRELSLPCAVLITGLDRDNADFGGVLGRIRDVWGRRCVPVVMPRSGGTGVLDVLDPRARPADLPADAQAARSSLVELAAETDDALTEKYLGGEDLTPPELARGLRAAVARGSLIPVFAAMPLRDVGVQELLEGIVRLLPSPLDRRMKDAEGRDIDPSPTAPFAGFVWRSVIDQHVGQLSFVRVFGGTLRSDSEVVNAAKGEKERIASLLVVNGKAQTTTEAATAGDVVALTKLKHTRLNDALCATGQKITFKPLSFPNPVTWFAVSAKSRGDEDKISVALARLTEEDPTLRVERNTETHETVLSGMGDVHLDVAVAQMKARSNVDILLSTPKVPYRETVTSTGEGHYKHKKQTGGRGQYGEVYLKVSRRAEGDEEWFVNDIVGGAIPINFIPAVQKGLQEGLAKGAVAGYPVTNVKVSVYDGTFHEVDSSEIAFKIAGSRAFRDGMSKARPVLLEPIMTVKVFVPDAYMGTVTGDVSHKRGRILGMAQEPGMQVITAEIPLAELYRYAAELRSMTSGQGTFEMAFARYDIVPSNIAQKVVAAAEKVKQDDEE